MLPDPMSITFLSTTHSLPRVEVSGSRTLYMNADETVTLAVTQSVTKAQRKRHEVRFVWSKVVADPITSVNDVESVTIALSIDRPKHGFTAADIDGFLTGIKNALTTTRVTEIYGGQA